ncbi:hypothetical protein LDENG_00028930 [Lucifuga dentata]|nr:hypothetical protein LDENG_00028930 [Lucifuga dentata]
MKSFNLCVFLSLAVSVYCEPEENFTAEEISFAMSYLQKFYHLDPHGGLGGRTSGPDSVSAKLEEMQQFFGLQITGKLNAATLELMKKPRCGIPDIKVGLFATHGARWNKNDLTYRIENYTQDMSMSEIDYAIEKALDVWASDLL